MSLEQRKANSTQGPSSMEQVLRASTRGRPVSSNGAACHRDARHLRLRNVLQGRGHLAEEIVVDLDVFTSESEEKQSLRERNRPHDERGTGSGEPVEKNSTDKLQQGMLDDEEATDMEVFTESELL